MKKKILKRILALTIVFLMIISTPFYISQNINNNPYVYADVGFADAMESELLKQSLIPMLISAGLVFTSSASAVKARDGLIHYFIEINEDPVNPQEPEGPKWKDIIIETLKSGLIMSYIHGVKKQAILVKDSLWELIRCFVNDNYDEGENDEGFEHDGYINGYAYRIRVEQHTNPNYSQYYYYNVYISGSNGSDVVSIISYDTTIPSQEVLSFNILNIFNNAKSLTATYELNDGYGLRTRTWAIRKLGIDLLPYNSENEVPESNIIYGISDIVDNQNYDWNNKYTGTKTIPIPIETDVYGNPIKDENGLYIPSIDIETWIDVQPTEIPNLDPRGIPSEVIPEMPEIEDPDEQTGIMIYIGNILQLIVGQLAKIVEGINTIIANTNQMIFGTPTPVFDPTTGVQIDPETGESIPESEPETSTGDGIIGDGIDTNIPTDFEWGDFKHLLDIFFIFIYFIVILILILLKFLQVVFTGLPAIAANTELFIQYPNILEGVNFVKNLQVGGMSITVQQAFEYIFLIFFYIFIIKQIRKLYNARVFEESAENKRNTEDMKLDYYDKKKDNYENIKSIGWSDDKKKDNYENIKLIGWSDDK